MVCQFTTDALVLLEVGGVGGGGGGGGGGCGRCCRPSVMLPHPCGEHMNPNLLQLAPFTLPHSTTHNSTISMAGICF